jgi:hypothetical protein
LSSSAAATCRARLRRLGQQPIDELDGRTALEQGQDIGAIEDQRQAPLLTFSQLSAAQT